MFITGVTTTDTSRVVFNNQLLELFLTSIGCTITFIGLVFLACY